MQTNKKYIFINVPMCILTKILSCLTDQKITIHILVHLIYTINCNDKR